MPEIRRVAVLGCGLMGSGIAEIAAKAGYDTYVREIDDAFAEKGRAAIQKSLDRAVDKGKLDAAARDGALGRIRMTTRLEDLAGADIVIEAVTEDLEVKLRMFRTLDSVCGPEATIKEPIDYEEWCGVPAAGAGLAGEFRLRLGGQGQYELVEQVRHAPPVVGRDGMCLLPAEGPELGRLQLPSRVVRLVDRHEHRRAGGAEQFGGFLVRRGQPADRIDDEDDDVRLGDRQPRLDLDLGLDRVVRVNLQAAGVNQDEPPAVPLGVSVQAVPGRPRPILNDRGTFPDDPVEERALAHVRAPDDRDDG